MEHPGYICASLYVSKSQENFPLSSASARKEAWIEVAFVGIGGGCHYLFWVGTLFS